MREIYFKIKQNCELPVAMLIYTYKDFDGVIQYGTQYKLRLFGVTCWVSNHFANAGWFRLFGRGLKWKHESLGLLFGERNGYTKYLKIGKWIIGYLPCM